jgi:hypothetical protein
VKIADRIQMLFNQNQARKPIGGPMLTPNESLICRATDMAIDALRQEMLGKLAEKQPNSARGQE